SVARTAAAPLTRRSLSGDQMPLRRLLRQRGSKLSTRGDPELREDLAQMPLDRLRTDKQPPPDFRVREPLPCEPGDLLLLRRQLVAGIGTAFADFLTGGYQLAARGFGERGHTDLDENFVRRPQLLACIDATAFAAQPLAIEEMRARLIGTELAPLQPLDRLAIEEGC